MQEGIFASSSYDSDRSAVAAYNLNLPGKANVADLTNFDPRLSSAKILIAGAPCQGFSTSGRRDIDDPRNALLMRVADIALANKSKVVLIENVPAAISGPHSRLWEAVEYRMRMANYNVRRILLEGKNVGIAQRRKRLFLLCWKGSDCLQVDLRSSPSVNLYDALTRIDEASNHLPEWPLIGSRDWLISRHIPPGYKLSNVRIGGRSIQTWNIPEVYGEVSDFEKELLINVSKLRRRSRKRTFGDGDPVPQSLLQEVLGRDISIEVNRLEKLNYLRRLHGAIELKHTYNGRYRRLSWFELAPTVDTKFGRPDLFLHPDQHRGMTAREACRIQGFPDFYRLMGSRRDIFMQIGNAVPPPMGAYLGRFIRDAILKA